MLYRKATPLRAGVALTSRSSAPGPATDWDATPLRQGSLRPSGRLVVGGGRRGITLRDVGLAAGVALIGTAVVACLPIGGAEGPRPAVQSAKPAAEPRLAAANAAVLESLPHPATTLAALAPERAVAAQTARLDPDSTAAFASASAAPRDPVGAKLRSARVNDDPPLPNLRQLAPRGPAPLKQAVTRLVGFDAAPFPYDGLIPGTQQPFLNTEQGEERGHRSGRGRLFLESETFGDNRVLAHIPRGFDLGRPGVMVVFFHGHGATLKRDVMNRQQVPAQVSASGANAVLVAPQFAVDASDSSAGRFWEEGGFARFLDESAQRLAKLHGGGEAAERAFREMPVVVVTYSGGFVPAAYAVQAAGGAQDRVRGVVLLDSIYGEYEKFANWAASGRGKFLVNASTPYTRRQAGELERQLAARSVPVSTELKGNLSRGGAVFLNTGPDANHRDYVTQAWTEKPIADVLQRLPEYRLRGPEAVASLGRREQRAGATE
ncbi:hypothetical protein [Enterovirga sp.]|uniref:hypothetical protein n=1 Tax=Enterovirga sp. TaxID=2026350 RepID=UPI00261D598B|nr:hypothetical protein [Enterovirga sp.]MDB5590415.1 putative alpha/beta-hydrolase family protein [Enterovirga sp.]